MHVALDKITVKNWASCIQHAEQLQEEDFWQDEILEKVLINIRDNSECEVSSMEKREVVDSDFNEPITLPLT